MDRKIILAVAPTGDVIACARAGAAVVHLHARDEKGALTTDLAPFAAAVEAITDACDIILEASTGGLSDLTAAERVLPASNPRAEMGSLNIGSLNFGDAVYRKRLPC